MYKTELEQEECHLQSCLSVIRENIQKYEKEYNERHTQVTELHRARNSGDVEVYNQLMTAASLEEEAQKALRKNQAALKKPYFGRIDYIDLEQERSEQVYIGKHGISQNKTEVMIADWRAPISSVYYENELGRGEYGLADETPIPVDLKLKRTFDFEDGCLKGYYDSDVAANDELLIQYLSRNKDVVLREIIATIQQEQNAIIRETPFANLIVQGVAGSGKTTVAMHRISYLLYNYKERFESNEYCVVGGNDMLLNYITAGLPELDVSNVRHLRMDQLLCKLCEKEWTKKFRLTEPDSTAALRCSMDFIRSLDHFLFDMKLQIIPCKTLADKQFGTILSKSANITLLKENPDFSICKLLAVLEERTKNRIEFLMNGWDESRIEAKQKLYSAFWSKKKPTISSHAIYQRFLTHWMESYFEKASGTASSIRNSEIVKELFATHAINCASGNYDIYDLAALALIHYRVHQLSPNEELSLLFLDEAQDFGISIYYVLKNLLPNSYFTIMGDVSQNINYDTGMNDWDALRQLFLTEERDKFLQLNKSYRNTIEISEYAGKILEHTSRNPYKITPVIRHGKPVSEEAYWSDVEMAERVKDILHSALKQGYFSCAVICKTQEECNKTQMLLKELLPENALPNILPIHLVKGLEFDVVILWNPYMKQGLKSPDTAKLLYVATTRALHELYILQS